MQIPVFCKDCGLKLKAEGSGQFDIYTGQELQLYSCSVHESHDRFIINESGVIHSYQGE